MRIHPDGAIDVRHATDAGTGERLCKAYVAIEPSAAGPDGSDEPVWVQIAKVGHFEGHGAGPFDLTVKTFADIVRNFHEVDGREICFDFEHASEADPTEGSIPQDGAPAQGWIRELDNRGDKGLWALVEWLPLARDYIRTKRYKFVSPAIRFNARHPETGKLVGARLTSAALTNKPFLRSMQPLTAKDGSADAVTCSSFAYSSNEYMPALRAALRLPELATARECNDAIDRLEALYESANGDAGATVHGVRLGDYLPCLRDGLRLWLAATWDNVFDTAKALVAAADSALAEGDVTASDIDDETEEEATAVDASDRPDVEPGMAGGSDEETTTMADVQLKDIQAKNAELTLQLSQANARTTELEGDVKSLRDWKTQREEADLKSEVDAAFETYKDTHKLTDAQREDMVVLARANIDAFRRLYPRVAPQHRHLLRDVAGARTADTRPPGTGGAPAQTGAGERPTLRALTDKFMRENRMSFEDAQNAATKQLGIRQLIAH